MKYSKLLFFCVLTMLLAFSSCKKDEISEMEEMVDPTPVENITTNPLITLMSSSGSVTEGLDLGCFSVDFPFDLTADGSTYTIANNEDFEAVLLDGPEIVDFVYPISITYAEDGSTASVADGIELGEAFANCIPDTGWDENSFPAFLISDESSCYDLVYPLNLVDVDGNVSVANDEDEFIDLISTGDLLFFEFPLSLVDEDGVTVTADTDEELFLLLFDCEEISVPPGGGDPINDCWDYVFPFNMVDQNGDIVVINNHDDICNAALNGLILEYVFPLTLVDGDGVELVVNNQAELEAAFLDCIPDFPPGIQLDVFSLLINSDLMSAQTGVFCYSVIYPLEYTNTETGVTSTIDDAVAAQAYIDDPQSNPWGDAVSFPITITETDTGDQVTLDDMNAYFEFLVTCN